MRLGVFGGTFDPVHIGHLAAAEEAVYRLRLTQVLFVPAQRQPLKPDDPRASRRDRLAMLRLAVGDSPAFALSAIELERAAPSYTVDTLRLLRDSYGQDCELHFLLGIDAVNMLAHWREPAELLRLARLGVMSRGGVREPDWTMLCAIDPDARQRVTLIGVPNIDVSARELRRRVAAGEPIRYQVPDTVRAYIEQHRLYQPVVSSQ